MRYVGLNHIKATGAHLCQRHASVTAAVFLMDAALAFEFNM